MQSNPPDLVRVLRSAAWMWIGYLVALMFIDAFMYAQAPRPMLADYYLMHGAIALLFLGLSYWSWLRETLKSAYVPLMLLVIAGLPIVAGRLGMPPLPPGPMSNIEGITLRMLPVLFVALVITAWQYPWPVVALFAVATAVLEIGAVQVFRPPADPSAAQAVTFVAIVRSVSFLVVGYFMSRLIRRLQTQQDELVQANAQLAHYASTLEQLAVSRERNRLARELHDTLAHTLSGLTVQLETAQAYWDVDPATALRLLAQCLAAARSGLDETRRALKALRASPLEDLGLLLALSRLAESAAERGKLQLELSLPDRISPLSPDMEQCVYRVAQEALENVVHHANAGKLALCLSVQAGGAVLLTVQDDGLGLDPERSGQAGHFGLAGMRERAELAGGTVTLSSLPGQGTRVQLALPAPRTPPTAP